jgi:hypothetical protein
MGPIGSAAFTRTCKSAPCPPTCPLDCAIIIIYYYDYYDYYYYYHYYYYFVVVHVLVVLVAAAISAETWVHLVLQPLLPYCTSPR